MMNKMNSIVTGIICILSFNVYIVRALPVNQDVEYYQVDANNDDATNFEPMRELVRKKHEANWGFGGNPFFPFSPIQPLLPPNNRDRLSVQRFLMREPISPVIGRPSNSFHPVEIIQIPKTFFADLLSRAPLVQPSQQQPITPGIGSIPAQRNIINVAEDKLRQFLTFNPHPHQIFFQRVPVVIEIVDRTIDGLNNIQGLNQLFQFNQPTEIKTRGKLFPQQQEIIFNNEATKARDIPVFVQESEPVVMTNLFEGNQNAGNKNNEEEFFAMLSEVNQLLNIESSANPITELGQVETNLPIEHTGTEQADIELEKLNPVILLEDELKFVTNVDSIVPTTSLEPVISIVEVDSNLNDIDIQEVFVATPEILTEAFEVISITEQAEKDIDVLNDQQTEPNLDNSNDEIIAAFMSSLMNSDSIFKKVNDQQSDFGIINIDQQKSEFEQPQPFNLILDVVDEKNSGFGILDQTISNVENIEVQEPNTGFSNLDQDQSVLNGDIVKDQEADIDFGIVIEQETGSGSIHLQHMEPLLTEAKFNQFDQIQIPESNFGVVNNHQLHSGLSHVTHHELDAGIETLKDTDTEFNLNEPTLSFDNIPVIDQLLNSGIIISDQLLPVTNLNNMREVSQFSNINEQTSDFNIDELIAKQRDDAFSKLDNQQNINTVSHNLSEQLIDSTLKLKDENIKLEKTSEFNFNKLQQQLVTPDHQNLANILVTDIDIASKFNEIDVHRWETIKRVLTDLFPTRSSMEIDDILKIIKKDPNLQKTIINFSEQRNIHNVMELIAQPLNLQLNINDVNALTEKNIKPETNGIVTIDKDSITESNLNFKTVDNLDASKPFDNTMDIDKHILEATVRALKTSEDLQKIDHIPVVILDAEPLEVNVKEASNVIDQTTEKLEIVDHQIPIADSVPTGISVDLKHKAIISTFSLIPSEAPSNITNDNLTQPMDSSIEATVSRFTPFRILPQFSEFGTKINLSKKNKNGQHVNKLNKSQLSEHVKANQEHSIHESSALFLTERKLENKLQTLTEEIPFRFDKKNEKFEKKENIEKSSKRLGKSLHQADTENEEVESKIKQENSIADIVMEEPIMAPGVFIEKQDFVTASSIPINEEPESSTISEFDEQFMAIKKRVDNIEITTDVDDYIDVEELEFAEPQNDETTVSSLREVPEELEMVDSPVEDIIITKPDISVLDDTILDIDPVEVIEEELSEMIEFQNIDTTILPLVEVFEIVSSPDEKELIITTRNLENADEVNLNIDLVSAAEISDLESKTDKMDKEVAILKNQNANIVNDTQFIIIEEQDEIIEQVTISPVIGKSEVNSINTEKTVTDNQVDTVSENEKRLDQEIILNIEQGEIHDESLNNIEITTISLPQNIDQQELSFTETRASNLDKQTNNIVEHSEILVSLDNIHFSNKPITIPQMNLDSVVQEDSKTISSSLNDVSELTSIDNERQTSEKQKDSIIITAENMKILSDMNDEAVSVFMTSDVKTKSSDIANKIESKTMEIIIDEQTKLLTPAISDNIEGPVATEQHISNMIEFNAMKLDNVENIGTGIEIEVPITTIIPSNKALETTQNIDGPKPSSKVMVDKSSTSMLVEDENKSATMISTSEPSNIISDNVLEDMKNVDISVFVFQNNAQKTSDQIEMKPEISTAIEITSSLQIESEIASTAATIQKDENIMQKKIEIVTPKILERKVPTEIFIKNTENEQNNTPVITEVEQSVSNTPKTSEQLEMKHEISAAIDLTTTSLKIESKIASTAATIQKDENNVQKEIETVSQKITETKVPTEISIQNLENEQNNTPVITEVEQSVKSTQITSEQLEIKPDMSAAIKITTTSPTIETEISNTAGTIQKDENIMHTEIETVSQIISETRETTEISIQNTENEQNKTPIITEVQTSEQIEMKPEISAAIDLTITSHQIESEIASTAATIQKDENIVQKEIKMVSTKISEISIKNTENEQNKTPVITEVQQSVKNTQTFEQKEMKPEISAAIDLTTTSQQIESEVASIAAKVQKDENIEQKEIETVSQKISEIIVPTEISIKNTENEQNKTPVITEVQQSVINTQTTFEQKEMKPEISAAIDFATTSHQIESEIASIAANVQKDENIEQKEIETVSQKISETIVPTEISLKNIQNKIAVITEVQKSQNIPKPVTIAVRKDLIKLAALTGRPLPLRSFTSTKKETPINEKKFFVMTGRQPLVVKLNPSPGRSLRFNTLTKINSVQSHKTKAVPKTNVEGSINEQVDTLTVIKSIEKNNSGTDKSLSSLISEGGFNDSIPPRIETNNKEFFDNSRVETTVVTAQKSISVVDPTSGRQLLIFKDVNREQPIKSRTAKHIASFIDQVIGELETRKIVKRSTVV